MRGSANPDLGDRVDDVQDKARDAANSKTMSYLARLGLAARAFIYLVMGFLAIQIALGHQDNQANQRGALAEVAQQTGSDVLLWVLGLGFVAYAIWRFSEAAFGTAAEGKETGPRLQSLVRGVVYAFLAVTTFSFISGATGESQSKQQTNITGEIMKYTFGRFAVGLAGLIVVVVGGFMIYEGATRKFEKQLMMHEMSAETRRVVGLIGMVGTIARGAVFAIAGVLVVAAAVSYDPKKSTGLDGALRSLSNATFGPVLIFALAVGLILFGLFGFAQAKWAKT